MGNLLDEAIELVKGKEIDQQVKEICDQIIEQETEPNGLMPMNELMPIGPNIFLAINCPGRIKQEIAFLTLEREMLGQYIIAFWAKNINNKDDILKRYRVWSIMEISCKQIIKSFAEKLKYVRGDIT